MEKKQHIVGQPDVTVQIGKFKIPAQNFFPSDIKKFDTIIGVFFMEQWGSVFDPKEKKLKKVTSITKLQQEEFETIEETKIIKENSVISK